MPETTEELIQRGFAPIKEEYRLTKEEIAALEPVQTDDAAGDAPSTPVETRANVPRNKRRGVDRGREKKMTKARADIRAKTMRLCPSVLIPDKDCRFGEKCTCEHDIEVYLAQKPKDLGEECPVFNAQGKCNYSYACRFGGAHTKGEEQLTKEPSPDYKPVINTNFAPIQIAMRKHQYDFSRADQIVKTLPDEGPVGAMERVRLKLNMRDLKGKPYLAPLTTVGNLPFRRLAVKMGAEITCSEMAVATSILQGAPSEWSLLKRHHTEKIFGIQLAGGYPDALTRAAQIVVDELEADFIDINLGCPLDVVNDKGGGCALAERPGKLLKVVSAMSQVMKDVPLTLKMRYGIREGTREVHHVMNRLAKTCPPALITLHPRSKTQRYTRDAEWDYIPTCAAALEDKVPLWVCGDVITPQMYYRNLEEYPIDGIMVGRGALIKPWIFKELEDKQLWDISASERLDICRDFVNFGLEHWGSDDAGVETCRRFMLEWLSFAHRYIPVGLLEVLPPKINMRPPAFRGRSDIETLLASAKCNDWVKITEMFLGPVPDGFLFAPKHKANAF
uniref:tRNA-dihydrouridine(47) synthase [NAD(P)(+)] n=1 Tax=Panagrellus redivivus TaxID=6233 RepID=A0A7E4UQF9_PANRE